MSSGDMQKPFEKLVTFDAGTSPEPLPAPNTFRRWQATAFGKLDGRLWRTLTAPTGSGKSFLIKALASSDLTRDPKAKVVIAVPQVIIGESFGCSTIHVDKRRTYNFAAEHVLLDGNGVVARLVAFLLQAAGPTLASRTLVCTHATLVAAHKRVLELKRKRDPWEDVSLYIDEMHHSDASEEGAKGDAGAAAARKVGNQLGRLVSYWLDKGLGHLLLATATPLRADPKEPLVPPSRAGEFVSHEYEWADYIASMQHLRRIIFRFILGEPEDALRTLFAEGQEKTIVYLPHVSSSITQDRGGKAGTLHGFMAAIGPVVRSDEWTTTLRCKAARGKAKTLRVFDAVTVAWRDGRREHFMRAIKAGTCPDVMFALNIGKEGFDWPPVARAVVNGERASLPDVLQMLGRLLRDVEGKSEIEFTMVLPGGGAEDDVESVCWYLKKILATLLIADFLRPQPGPRVPLEKMGDAIGGLVDGILAAGDLPSDAPLGGRATREGKAGGGDKTVPPIWIPLEAEKATSSSPRHAPTMAVPAPDDSEEKDDAPKRLLSSRVRAIPEAYGLAWNPEYVVYAREMMRVVAFKKSGKTLTQIRDESGVRAAWPSEDVVRAFSQGKSQDAYDAQRDIIGGPSIPGFRGVYGKTFQEIRDGHRRGRVWPSEDTVRAFAHGKSVAEYNSMRLAIGAPSASAFNNAYGKTFREVRDGTRFGGGWPSESTVAAFVHGKSRSEYDACRGTIGGPSAAILYRVYGKTFVELRDGATCEWPSEIAVRRFVQGHSQLSYNAHRMEFGGPVASRFQDIYGKTFQELRDGRRRDGGIWPAEKDVRAFIQGKSTREYDAQRDAIGGPTTVHFQRIYGKTFLEIRDGKRRVGEWPSDAVVRMFIRGKSVGDYDAQRGVIKGPMSTSFQRIYSRTFSEIRDGAKGQRVQRAT